MKRYKPLEVSIIIGGGVLIPVSMAAVISDELQPSLKLIRLTQQKFFKSGSLFGVDEGEGDAYHVVLRGFGESRNQVELRWRQLAP